MPARARRGGRVVTRRRLAAGARCARMGFSRWSGEGRPCVRNTGQLEDGRCCELHLGVWADGCDEGANRPSVARRRGTGRPAFEEERCRLAHINAADSRRQSGPHTREAARAPAPGARAVRVRVCAVEPAVLTLIPVACRRYGYLERTARAVRARARV